MSDFGLTKFSDIEDLFRGNMQFSEHVVIFFQLVMAAECNLDNVFMSCPKIQDMQIILPYIL